MTSSPPSVVVLLPIAPSPTGNGLAMRAWHLVCAAAMRHRTHAVVIPIAGTLAVADTAPTGAVGWHELESRQLDEPGEAMAWFADPVWRPRLQELAPLYPGVRHAPPTMAADVRACLGDVEPAAVVTLRLSLAPLGLALADQYGAELVIDADDDDVEWHASRGDLALAQAARRIGGLCYPRAALVTAANAADARRMTERYGLLRTVIDLPNGVDVTPSSPLAPPTGAGRVLFVGNLTYPPNVEGAQWLVREVLPLLAGHHELDLVGNPTDEVRALAGGRVRVRGSLSQLELVRVYAGADVAVVPLWSGSGTRIKVLEAFSYGRPVVSTTRGADGIEAVDGTHLLLADDPAGFARAIERAGAPNTAGRIVEAARALVRERYDARSVRARFSELLAQVTEAGRVN